MTGIIEHWIQFQIDQVILGINEFFIRDGFRTGYSVMFFHRFIIKGVMICQKVTVSILSGVIYCLFSL